MGRNRLAGRGGPFVAATDYMRAFADQIRPFVPGRYSVLGTDGFGRSDYRVKLRQFFEVDRYHVAVTALKALADEGVVEPAVVQGAIERYGIDVSPRRPGSGSPLARLLCSPSPRRPPSSAKGDELSTPPLDTALRDLSVRDGHWLCVTSLGTSVGLPIRPRRTT